MIQKHFSIPVPFFQIHSLYGSIKLPSLKFLPCNYAKKFFSKASFSTEFDFIKTQFYSVTWCLAKMLIQHLILCITFHSKTYELWKKGWSTRSYQIFLFKNCLLFQFFSQIHSVKENTKLAISAFSCCKKLQELIFRKQSFLQNLTCRNNKCLWNLMRCKAIDSKSDAICKNWLELWREVNFLIGNLTLCRNSQTNMFSEVIFLGNRAFLESTEKATLAFLRCNCAKINNIFPKRFWLQNLIL